LVCMATMIYYNLLIFGLFVGFLAVGYVYFKMTGKQRADAMPQGVSAPVAK
jgi:ethanolamine permease